MSNSATITRTNANNVTVNGTADADTVSLLGTGSNVYIDLLGGNDTLNIDPATNTNVGYTNLTVMGGSDADTISGAGSNSLLLGNTGDDLFLLDSPNARGITVFGGQGNDVFGGGLRGRDGPGTVVDPNVQGRDLLIFGNIGSERIDITDALGSNTVYGGQDSDTILGSNAGNDFLSGDLGNDFITLGAGGNSRAFGGQGNDAFFVPFGDLNEEEGTLSGISGATIYGGQGSDTVSGGSSFGGIRDPAILNDSLVFGNKGTDYLFIDAASDDTSVFGGQDNDVIVAQPGLGADDTVSGDLYLSGDLGNDLIIANGVNATLAGGQGADTFNVTGAVADGSNTLLIADFETGQDLVSFSGPRAIDIGSGAANGNYVEIRVNASGYAAAAQAATATGQDYAFVQTTGGSYLFYNNGANGQEVVQLGNLTADQFAASDITGDGSNVFVPPEENGAPIARQDSVIADRSAFVDNEATLINLLANDEDPDGDNFDVNSVFNFTAQRNGQFVDAEPILSKDSNVVASYELLNGADTVTIYRNGDVSTTLDQDFAELIFTFNYNAIDSNENVSNTAGGQLTVRNGSIL